ncbi:MAG: preprotein translocase subunit SecG [Pseudomonadota bacterium]
MTSTLLIVQIVLALAITIAVLLQKSSSIGLGAYSGSNESVFGAKGPTGFLAKFTFILGFAFVVNTLAIGYLYTSASTSSIADTIVPENNAMVPTVPTSTETTTQTNEVVANEAVAPQSAQEEAPVAPESIVEENASMPTEETANTTEENLTQTPATPAQN